ncbi:hypothetical protein C0V75_06720 [Tabrizicola sp. TH137]|uniref:hypothetical protein n=1 Tax=Tabrizicola sp. TH137 TaxID=2067452 RepID=UPI000C79D6A9|nr:hypothetical protein [Tabrizicola sp. TH137]PLL13106.1 hypothetical protein C0V75_06720 [Tabrizicola sp. TH137]
MKARAALLLLVTLAFGAAPFLTPPFRGYDPALFPVQIARPSIQPAGYAFGIWSVIYLWLFVHAVTSLWKRMENATWDRTRWPLILSIALGSAWLSIAPVAPIAATVTILIMAAAAITAFLRADTGTDRWLLSAPTAILAGWLSAAAAVSTGVVIAGYGLLSDTASALAMIAATLALSLWVQSKKPAMPIYGLTVIWALGGIIAVNAGVNPTVAIVAGLGIGAMAMLLGRQMKSSR